MLKAAIWVHGNVVQPEDLSMITGGYPLERKGWGTEFYVKGPMGGPYYLTWFHFPMPTPVILDDIRPQLAKVFVFYQTHSTRISHIHIYDGAQKVKAFDGLALSGDHSTGVDASNSWVINPPITIAYGLGISIGVDFLDAPQGDPKLPSILFTTAGADFVTP